MNREQRKVKVKRLRMEQRWRYRRNRAIKQEIEGRKQMDAEDQLQEMKKES